jgi:SRSO17 transposase
VANCQVGLFLVGVVSDGAAMLDHHLYLPSSWCDETEEGRERRAKVHVPEDLRFRTRAQVAADLVRGVVVLGQVRLDWVVSPEPYATSDEFLDELERLEQRYLMEVPGTTVVADLDTPAIGPSAWPALLNHAPAARWSVAAVYERWPDLWFRSGSSDWAVVRVRPERLHGPGGPAWLVMRRSPGPTAPRFYLSNSGSETPPELLPRVLEAQERASGYLDETRRLLGQGHYETRSWIGWHHHMSLVALAHLAVTLSRPVDRAAATEPPGGFPSW